MKSPSARTRTHSRRARPSASGNVTVGDLDAALNTLAPYQYAAAWDNVGLLAGDREWAVSRVLVSVDLTDAVADEALKRHCGAVVAYHPSIFKPIQRITPDGNLSTTRLPALMAARTAVLSVHTAWDATPGGTNDVLLDALDVADRCPLEQQVDESAGYKLVTFVPQEDLDRLRSALAGAGAGHIGHYEECSFTSTGVGTFHGDGSTRPAVGRPLRLESVPECRLEMILPRSKLNAVVRTLYAEHGYEEPAFDLIPLHAVAGRGAAGAGRLARLRSPQIGTRLLRRLGGIASLREAYCVGDLRRRFTHVAAAAGSFGVERFRDPDTLYITGEFKHHDALSLLRRMVTAIALGHDESERPGVIRLADQLQSMLKNVAVLRADADRSPRTPLSGILRPHTGERT